MNRGTATFTIGTGLDPARLDGHPCDECSTIFDREGVEHDSTCPKALALEAMYQSDREILASHGGSRGIAVRPVSSGDLMSLWPVYLVAPEPMVVILAEPAPGIRTRRITGVSEVQQVLVELGALTSRSRVRRIVADLIGGKE